MKLHLRATGWRLPYGITQWYVLPPVVWNSPDACWRWLFQTWKFRRCTRSQCGFNLFARWHRRLRFKRWV